MARFWTHCGKCKTEGALSCYGASDLQNLKGGAVARSLRGSPDSCPGGLKALPSWWLMVMFVIVLKKRGSHPGVGGSPLVLVFNCCKSHLSPCVLAHRKQDPLQQPGVATSGSSNCPETILSPLCDSGSASSSGRPS